MYLKIPSVRDHPKSRGHVPKSRNKINCPELRSFVLKHENGK